MAGVTDNVPAVLVKGCSETPETHIKRQAAKQAKPAQLAG